MAFSFIKTASGARNILIGLWYGFFILNISLVLYFYLDGWIEKDNFYLAMEILNGLYAPYIGAITLFYWSGRHIEKPSQAFAMSTPFTIACLGSLLWNGLLFSLFLPLFFQSGTLEDSVEVIRDMGGSLSWLVAGAIGYYFGSPVVQDKSPQKEE